MSFRTYLSFIGLGTFLAAFACGVVLVNISPTEAGLFGFVLFYITLFASLVGISTIMLSIVRVYVLKRQVIVREVRRSFRQSVLFSLLTITSLIMAANDVFTPWYGILLIAFAVLVEYLFLQFQKGR